MLSAVYVFGLLLTLPPVGQDAAKYDLQWRPKVGHVVEYRLSMRDETEGHVVRAGAKLRAVVRAASAEHGFAVRTDMYERTSDTEGGHLQPEDVSDIWLESDSDEDADAEKLEDFSTTADLLAAHLSDNEVKVGDQWTMKVDEDDQIYKLVAVEPVEGKPALKITLHIDDGKVKEDGTYWLRASDSQVLKTETNLAGTTKGDDGTEYSFKSVYTMDMLRERDEPLPKPTAEELALTGDAEKKVKAEYASALDGKTTLADYDLSFQEYRDSRLVVLTSKKGVSFVKYPNGVRIEIQFDKKDKKFLGISIDSLEPAADDSVQAHDPDRALLHEVAKHMPSPLSILG